MPSTAGWARPLDSLGLQLQPQIGTSGAPAALQNGSKSELDTESRREALVPKATRLGSPPRRSTRDWKPLLEEPAEVQAVWD